MTGHTDKRTDTVPFCTPCSAYYEGSVNNYRAPTPSVVLTTLARGGSIVVLPTAVSIILQTVRAAEMAQFGGDWLAGVQYRPTYGLVNCRSCTDMPNLPAPVLLAGF